MTISPITSSATLRVFENGALKTGTPIAARGVDVDLIGADVEAADRDQPVGGGEHLGVDLRARADADHVHALDRLPQRLALERLRQALDAGIAGRLHQLDGAVVDALEQQDPDPVFGERELRGLRIGVGHGGFPVFWKRASRSMRNSGSQVDDGLTACRPACRRRARAPDAVAIRAAERVRTWPVTRPSPTSSCASRHSGRKARRRSSFACATSYARAAMRASTLVVCPKVDEPFRRP